MSGTFSQLILLPGVGCRAAGYIRCWPAWRSLCCLRPTPPLDSWPGDVLSSAARWQVALHPLSSARVIFSMPAYASWVDAFWLYHLSLVEKYFITFKKVLVLLTPCLFFHRSARGMKHYLPSICSSAWLPGIQFILAASSMRD